MRERATGALKIAFSVGLIGWTFSRVPLAEVGSQVATARPGYLVAALGVFLLDILADGAKWHVLLRAQGFEVPRKTVLRLQFIGFFFNNFLPSANLGGDLARGFGLARLTERPACAAVSVVLDRALGLLAYMSSAVVAGTIAVNLEGRQGLRQVQVVAILTCLAILVVLGLLLSVRVRAGITRLLRWHRLLPLARAWADVARAMDDYHSRSGVLPAAFGIALLGIGCASLATWLLSQAMGGQMALPMVLLLNPLIALVLMLPISIGGLGVSQAAFPFFYGMAGVTAQHALAVSLLLQLTHLVASLPGAFFWLRTRYTRKSLAQPVEEGAL